MSQRAFARVGARACDSIADEVWLPSTGVRVYPVINVPFPQSGLKEYQPVDVLSVSLSSRAHINSVILI